MRSSYKRIGQYVRQANNRNTNLVEMDLKGVNINKEFMPSVANIHGTDLSKYKIVSHKQFAYNPMHVGRDEVLPISMLESEEPVIVSPAYAVFEIIDTDELLPEYLMMWCRRHEFDRNAWFTTDSSVRGGFNWDDFCDLTLPVPHVDKQREILREYNTIVERIKLNEKVNQKLEESSQTLYKKWFVDFEFPISKEYSELIGKLELEGKPYKSSGGQFTIDDPTGAELPKDWRRVAIQALIDEDLLENNQDGNHGELHPKSSEFVSAGIPFVMANDISNGVIDLRNCKFITKERAQKLRIGFAMKDDVLITHKATMGRVAIVPEVKEYIVLTPQVTYYRIKDKEKISKEFLYGTFTSTDFQQRFCNDSEQSTRKYLGITNQRKLYITLPSNIVVEQYSAHLKSLLEYKNNLMVEISHLEDLCHVLTSRMING